MRRLLPLWASLVAVLLLLQWSGAAGACLTQFDGPAMVVCHVAADSGPLQPGGGDHADMTCPLCAPLPPVLLVAPPQLPLPVVAPGRPMSELPAHKTSIVPLLTPQQPRAPPSLS